MHRSMPAALCAVAAVSGCASTRPPAITAAPPVAYAPVAVAPEQSNRFEMIQNGRPMRVDDFDAWMKARGIRIAKGPPVVVPQSGNDGDAQARGRY